MKRRTLLFTFLATIQLFVLAYFTGWQTQIVVQDSYYGNGVELSGKSLAVQPRPFFRSSALVGTVGRSQAIDVRIDSNGGSLSMIEATITYSPVDFVVNEIRTTDSICTAVTRQGINQNTGTVTFGCTAPSGGLKSQISHMATLIITPQRSGSLPLRINGAKSDYMIVRVAE